MDDHTMAAQMREYTKYNRKVYLPHRWMMWQFNNPLNLNTSGFAKILVRFI